MDGGIWANNPAAVAVTEAVGVLGVAPQVIEVLSVGTTTEPFHAPKRKASAGRLSWLRPGLKLLMQAQEAGSAGLAHAITEHTRRLVRINETTTPGRFRLDGSAAIDELKSLGHRGGYPCREGSWSPVSRRTCLSFCGPPSSLTWDDLAIGTRFDALVSITRQMPSI